MPSILEIFGKPVDSGYTKDVGGDSYTENLPGPIKFSSNTSGSSKGNVSWTAIANIFGSTANIVEDLYNPQKQYTPPPAPVKEDNTIMYVIAAIVVVTVVAYLFTKK